MSRLQKNLKRIRLGVRINLDAIYIQQVENDDDKKTKKPKKNVPPLPALPSPPPAPPLTATHGLFRHPFFRAAVRILSSPGCTYAPTYFDPREISNGARESNSRKASRNFLIRRCVLFFIAPISFKNVALPNTIWRYR